MILVDRMDGANLIPFLLYQLALGDSLQERFVFPTLFRIVLLFTNYVAKGMGQVYTGLMQAVGAAEKVFEFIDRQSRMPLDVGTHDPTHVDGKIEFKDVSFYYPSRPGNKILLENKNLRQIKRFCQICHWNSRREK